MIYILVLIIIVRYTDGYLPGLIFSIVAVICVNYLFTYPYFKLNFTLSGYPVTFLEMLSVTLLISTITTNMKQQTMMIARQDKLLSESEKEKMRANLLRAISHDLRTPLTGIIGASSSYLDNCTFLAENEKNAIMGIGLSICKTIIIAHNGIINARNHHQGAEFYFALPKGEISNEF